MVALALAGGGLSRLGPRHCSAEKTSTMTLPHVITELPSGKDDRRAGPVQREAVTTHLPLLDVGEDFKQHRLSEEGSFFLVLE